MGIKMGIRILLALDDSPVALRVVDQALALAGALAAAPELHVLHVHPPIPLDFATRHIPRDDLEAYYREESEAVLKAPLARLAEAGYPVHTHLRVGPPAETVQALAQSLDCAYLCIGRHGRSALGEWLLGSVASRLLTQARVPLILVP